MKPEQEVTVEPKVRPYKSKSIIAALINGAVVYFFPGAKEWISENPEEYAALITVATLILRHFTSGKIKWKFWEKQSR